jgi:hypothetical protein
MNTRMRTRRRAWGRERRRREGRRRMGRARRRAAAAQRGRRKRGVVQTVRRWGARCAGRLAMHARCLRG